MPPKNNHGAGEDGPLTELDALKEAARVMLGFRTSEEMEELFRRKLVRTAVFNLDKALELTRARHQPDEFALALAIEMELLKQAHAAGHDLETLFNDSNYHAPPSEEIANLISSLWSGEHQP